MSKSHQDELLRKSGEEIKKRRLIAKLSQEDLALKANIDQSKLSKVERLGINQISWQKFRSLADALDVDIDFKFIERE